MGTGKGIVESSAELLLCCRILRGLYLMCGDCLQIWQHRKEAVRAKVAQRISVVRRSTCHRHWNECKILTVHETTPASYACLGDS